MAARGQLGEEGVATQLKEGPLGCGHSLVLNRQPFTGVSLYSQMAEAEGCLHGSPHPECGSALRRGGRPEQLQAAGLREGGHCSSQALWPGEEHCLWHAGNVSALTSTQEMLAQQYAQVFRSPLAPSNPVKKSSRRSP